jgi:hypothetical protein
MRRNIQNQYTYLEVVSQKPVNGKVSRLKLLSLPSDVYSCSVQVAALFARDHPAQRAVVLSLFPQLSRFRGNNAGTRDRGRPFDDQSLDLKVCPGTRQTHSTLAEATNDSWCVDETYIKIKSVWKYLYRAVDSEGNTLDFMPSAKRNGKAARFLRKVLKAQHTQTPRVLSWIRMALTQ